MKSFVWMVVTTCILFIGILLVDNCFKQPRNSTVQGTVVNKADTTAPGYVGLVTILPEQLFY